MARTTISIEHSVESQKDIENLFEHTDSKFIGGRLAAFFDALTAGFKRGNLRIAAGDAVRASGTITFSSFAADDVVTVNGVTFTAKVSPAGAQQFALGASDAIAAANLTAKINASALALVTGVVTAANTSSGVTTLTAVQPGLTGNCITIAISARGSVSGARLTGGAGAEVAHAFGQVAS